MVEQTLDFLEELLKKDYELKQEMIRIVKIVIDRSKEEKPIINQEQKKQKTQQIINIINSDVIFTQMRKGTINIAFQQLAKLPNEYRKSIEDLQDAINKQIQMHNIPTEQVEQIQESVIELARETEDIKKGKISYSKKTIIKAKLAAVAEGLLNILPKAAETITSLIPILAPFSELIGEGIEEVIKAIRSV